MAAPVGKRKVLDIRTTHAIMTIIVESMCEKSEGGGHVLQHAC